MIASAPPEIRTEILDSIEAQATAQGVNLASLGDWRRRFLAGEFEPAPGNQGSTAMYLGTRGGVDRFVVPQRFDPGANVQVRVDGQPLPSQNVRHRPAAEGRPFTLVEARMGPKPAGASILVSATGSPPYEGRRPPDVVTVTTTTSISRGPRSTTITVTPTVQSTDPGGTKNPPPSEGGPSPEGNPEYRVQDGDGFFHTLFTTLGVATSVAVPLGVAYLLRPQQSTTSTVRTNPDGSMAIEVPNETYDGALNAVQAANPNFNNRNVATGIEGGVSQTVPPASPGTGGGLVVLSVFSPGSSARSLPPGATVVFLVTGDPNLTSAFTLGNVRVELSTGGIPAGLMVVQQAQMDAGGNGNVTANLPPGLTSPTGTVTAILRCQGRSSQPVPLGLEPGAVEVVALQTVVLSGTAVQVILTSVSGGPIKGTLTLTGPGRFMSGGNAKHFDTWGTATAMVLTSRPGSIRVTFTPDEPGMTGREMEGFFK
ncbi:MAG: hypothetical protein ACYTHM_13825 [Planctomycetota bacterium]